MRRQSKPFVTEYRSSNRRAKGSSGLGSGAEGRPSDAESQRVAWPPSDDDDGLSAALAAADKLFSGPPKPADAGASSDAPRPGATSSRANGDSGRGRILQAIEKAEPVEAAAPESLAGYVQTSSPKRRGRKPGSKRSLQQADTAPGSEPPLDLADAGAFAENQGDDGIVDAATFRRELRPATLVAGQPAAVPANLKAATLERRRGERYPWVRTKLRPGERWKRRLPKVAW